MIRQGKIRIKDNTKISSRRTGCIVLFEEILSVGLSILESCAGGPMRRNSVLAGLRDKKFEAIHEEMLDIVFCKSRIFSEKASAENEDPCRNADD